jgi:hypothetical protein
MPWCWALASLCHISTTPFDFGGMLFVCRGDTEPCQSNAVMIPARSDPQNATVRGQGLQGQRGIANTMSPRICGELFACRSRPKIILHDRAELAILLLIWCPPKYQGLLEARGRTARPPHIKILLSREANHPHTNCTRCSF